MSSDSSPRRTPLVGYLVIGDGGLLATADNGATWKALHHAAPFDAVIGDPHEPLRLWLGNAHGLYRSDDGGATVTKVAEGLVSAIELDGTRLLVGGDGIRVSTDGGRTFRTAETGASRRAYRTWSASAVRSTRPRHATRRMNSPRVAVACCAVLTTA